MLLRRPARRPDGLRRSGKGVAQVLVGIEAPAFDGRFTYDSEGAMFCAYGADRRVLEELAARMGAVATDGERTRRPRSTASS
ncbi:Imm51 family immunity protein [Micromonospora sp. NPDC048986]|uniref:Imm51 family immunity protein n=1 Tax=Micromonospora sp. NPDC048986 TaxID=3155644 RepID=UPI0033D4A826